MVLHKSVREMVYCIVIDRGEIPGFVEHEGCSRLINGRAVRDGLGKGFNPMILLLVNFSQREA